ncbi:MAG: hypothetical protein ACOC0H_03805 [Thermodesulfobacteriota bacterium]
MSSNKFKPHLLVLPEDDANQQIATGFTLNPALDQRNITILRPFGGWMKTVDAFTANNFYEMRRYHQRRVLLLVDFDGHAAERLEFIQNQIPQDLEDRTFVFGSFSDPENLKTAMGMHFEAIGQALAQDCAEDRYTTWKHDLLMHNQSELGRMVASVRPFLFEESAAQL